TVTRMRTPGAGGRVLVRADSAFYGYPAIGAAVRAGAQVSVTLPLNPQVKKAIATITEQAWTPIQYTDAIFDETSKTWVSKAEVAEVPFTAFAAQTKNHHVQGRLVVRRIPELNPAAKTGQDPLFAL